MTTKTILQKTAELLNISVDFSQDNQTLSALISCARYILDELSGRYEELRKTESVESEGKRIAFSLLTDSAVRVLSVSSGEKKVPFVLYPTYIKVPYDGRFEVTYTYRLGSLGLNDAVVLPPKYSEETLSLGVAAEYLHRTGYDGDAEYFSTRYYTALKNLTSARKNIVLPARRFL